MPMNEIRGTISRCSSVVLAGKNSAGSTAALLIYRLHKIDVPIEQNCLNPIISVRLWPRCTPKKVQQLVRRTVGRQTYHNILKMDKFLHKSYPKHWQCFHESNVDSYYPKKICKTTWLLTNLKDVNHCCHELIVDSSCKKKICMTIWLHMNLTNVEHFGRQ